MGRNLVDKIGYDVHPRNGAKFRRVGVTPFYYCGNCGFPNDMRKTATGLGDGNVKVADATSTKPAIFNAQSGCAFCGSKNNPKVKAKDDRKAPAMENKNRRT